MSSFVSLLPTTCQRKAQILLPTPYFLLMLCLRATWVHNEQQYAIKQWLTIAQSWSKEDANQVDKLQRPQKYHVAPNIKIRHLSPTYSSKFHQQECKALHSTFRTSSIRSTFLLCLPNRSSRILRVCWVAYRLHQTLWLSSFFFSILVLLRLLCTKKKPNQNLTAMSRQANSLHPYSKTYCSDIQYESTRGGCITVIYSCNSHTLIIFEIKDNFGNSFSTDGK